MKAVSRLRETPKRLQKKEKYKYGSNGHDAVKVKENMKYRMWASKQQAVDVKQPTAGQSVQEGPQAPYF